VIPKIIHHIWLDESEAVPKTVFECISSSINQNPEFEHKMWSYSDLDFLFSILTEEQMSGIEILKKRITNNQTHLNVLMSGIFRVQLVNYFGGFYVDCDIRFHQPLPDKILSKDFFFVIPEKGSHWITDGIFGYSPDQPFVKHISSFYRPNFVPAPILFTNGVMRWLHSYIEGIKITKSDIINTLSKRKDTYLDYNDIFFSLRPPKPGHTVSSHLALSAWHPKGGKRYNKKILEEEEKISLNELRK